VARFSGDAPVEAIATRLQTGQSDPVTSSEPGDFQQQFIRIDRFREVRVEARLERALPVRARWPLPTPTAEPAREPEIQQWSG
jgi:hypothetical protein